MITRMKEAKCGCKLPQFRKYDLPSTVDDEVRQKLGFGKLESETEKRQVLNFCNSSQKYFNQKLDYKVTAHQQNIGSIRIQPG